MACTHNFSSALSARQQGIFNPRPLHMKNTLLSTLKLVVPFLKPPPY